MMFDAAPTLPQAQMFDSLGVAMNDATFVQVDDALFAADYLHAPDEFTRPDDVLVEGSRDDQELLLLQRDFDGARVLGDGGIFLRDGTLIRFLRPSVVH